MAKGSRFGPDAALVFSLTGLILAVPATLLPFVGAGKLGNERMSYLFTGIGALWGGGMQGVAVLVFLLGGLLPIALLCILACLHAPGVFGLREDGAAHLYRAARTLEHWAIPEVQVLAVLVAIMKLGNIVEVTVGPAFWCYCAMALSLILAQQSFNFESPSPPGGTADPQSP